MIRTRTIFYSLLIIFISVSFWGCLALELAEVSGVAEAAEGLNATEVATTARMGLVVTEEATLAIDNTAAFNESLPSLRFIPESGANPGIGILENGRLSQVAEVLVEEGKIRLRNGQIFSVNKEMYAANANEIIIRDEASLNGKEVGRVIRDRFLIKLSEENGWYRVRFAEYEEGFVDPQYLFFVAGNIKDKKKYYLLTHQKPISSFIGDIKPRSKSETQIVALAVADSLERDVYTTMQIKKSLEACGYTVQTELFTPEFISEGYFKLMLDGQVKQFKKIGLNKYADFICLVDKTVYMTSNQIKDMVSAKSSVNFIILDAATGFVVDSRFYSLAGAGFSKAQAIETLNRHLKQKLDSDKFTF